MMEINKIYQGNALEVLKKFPSEFVDCMITSPPYWGLRDYKINGQIGLESTPEEFLNKIWAIFDELKRVLKKTGTVWVNFGDTYSSQPSGSITGKGAFDDRPSKQAAMEACKRRKEQRFDKKNYGGLDEKRQDTTIQGRGRGADVPEKCLCMIPERFAIGMIERGWILRNKIVWHKPNPMPSSVKDRFANTWEYVYFFVKNKKYWFDLDAVREPHSNPNMVRKVNPNQSGTFGEKGLPKRMGSVLRERTEIRNYPSGKNPGDYWEITTQPYPEAHFATFPEKLCYKPILAGCPLEICNKCGKARERMTEINLTSIKKRNDSPEKKVMKTKVDADKKNVFPYARTGIQGINEYKTLGWTDCGCGEGFRPGIVMDIFCGSGTALAVAKRLARNYTGIDISKEYCKLARERIAKETPGMF